MPPHPWSSGGGARGPEGPPHSPPPPIQAHERTEADRRNGGPAPPPKRRLHPGCGGTTAEAGARTPRPLPTDGGPAVPRTAQTERPYQRPARGRRGRERGRGGSPPPPPPPPPHWPVGGRPDRARRPRPPGNPHGTIIPQGGTPETTDGRPTPDGARGRGGRPPHPPPAPPPQFGSHRSGPPPPRSRGEAPPPPRRDRDAGGGGMRLDLHTARPSAPSRLLPRGSRPQGEPTPACRSNARTKLGGGARRRTGTVWRPRPTLPSRDRSPLREGGGGVQACRGPRGSGPRAAPHPPRPRGGTATPTARTRRKGVRLRHEGGQD